MVGYNSLVLDDWVRVGEGHLTSWGQGLSLSLHFLLLQVHLKLVLLEELLLLLVLLP